MSPLHPAYILTTWFWVGRIPFAPGTWGSLAALPFGWALMTYGGWLETLFAAALLFAIGCWSSAAYARGIGRKDPGSAVIDEVVGQWMVLAVLPLDIWAYVMGFVLFRLFDVLKPWPVSVADRKLTGGFGIMADDVAAALYAMAVAALLVHFFW
ncbi:MAG: phosphatidylglycerophosphatase A [Alphaproteobacteria bacterium]|nr:phosphatidylglycerophosphatase A [Alphaproteobacteria bacterium]MBU0797788.1 phosphatidylglycerophosphatase A [Alphaproteobacteria bacterium]MBU0887850.1 phosphatidylglycerophosphatase A [Alphaproteobacteria bacterium]MBU1814927.1 phosphatidylglycerophosphatase A [Alphaproteobacteria bacterium]MBU2090535.1 phosphatidylglycerophosphatase A [Alphaproteobacteria bacterium]